MRSAMGRTAAICGRLGCALRIGERTGLACWRGRPRHRELFRTREIDDDSQIVRKIVSARRGNQHAGRAPFPEFRRLRQTADWYVRPRKCFRRNPAAFRSWRGTHQSRTDRSGTCESIIARRHQWRTIRKTLRARGAGCFHLHPRTHSSR